MEKTLEQQRENIPAEVLSCLNKDDVDFVVESTYSWSRAIWKFLLAVFVLSASVFLFHFLSHVPTSYLPDDRLILVIIAFPIMLFCIWIEFMIFVVSHILKRTTYFIGTSSQLLFFNKKTMKYLPWWTFSNMVSSSGIKKWKITLLLHREQKGIGKMLIMFGVPNVPQIEKLCAKRIWQQG